MTRLASIRPDAQRIPRGKSDRLLDVPAQADLGFSSLFSWRFWSDGLPGLWQEIDMLLAEWGTA